MESPSAFLELFTPAGLRVKLTLAVQGGQDANQYTLDPGQLLRDIDSFLSAGFTIDPPAVVGVGEGEHKDMCGWLVRSQSKSNMGGINNSGLSEVLDVYMADDRFSTVKAYLNTQADVDAFKAASGIDIERLPINVTGSKLERGKNPGMDKLIVGVKPFGFIWKQNPKWNKEEADATRAKGGIYKIPQRVFVRWANQTAAAAQPQTESRDGGQQQSASNAANEPTDAQIVQSYIEAMQECNDLIELATVADQIKADSRLTAEGRKHLGGHWKSSERRINDSVPF